MIGSRGARDFWSRERVVADRKNTIRDGGSTALQAVYTVDTTDTIDTVYIVDAVDTACILFKLLFTALTVGYLPTLDIVRGGQNAIGMG